MISRLSSPGTILQGIRRVSKLQSSRVPRAIYFAPRTSSLMDSGNVTFHQGAWFFLLASQRRRRATPSLQVCSTVHTSSRRPPVHRPNQTKSVSCVVAVGETPTRRRCLEQPDEHIGCRVQQVKTKLKINHWRLSPEPPELAGFYVDSVWRLRAGAEASNAPG